MFPNLIYWKKTSFHCAVLSLYGGMNSASGVESVFVRTETKILVGYSLSFNFLKKEVRARIYPYTVLY
jgi:hypothetical protein